VSNIDLNRRGKIENSPDPTGQPSRPSLSDRGAGLG